MLGTLTVSQYNNYIKQIFDAEELLHNIKIVGEVFGLSFSKTAIYFSLKDDGGMISCVCFYPDLLKDIQEGDKIIITGSPNYYVKGGRLSFNVLNIEKEGQGDLYKQFILMKNKLEKEGLFNIENKKPMPKIIKSIAVITSKDGAVIHDICNIAKRRDPSINIVLYPVKVQGNGADDEIVTAIKDLSEFNEVDVIVVARGGGSLEDLSAYNTEKVARATFDCKKFIMSAVGHETDFTIIDFVADLRAPTPSAAAELLTKEKSEQKNKFIQTFNTYKITLNNFIKNKFSLLKNNDENFQNLTEKYFLNKNYELGLLETSLNKLDPTAILKRGFAKIEQSGKVVDKAKNIMLESDLEIKFLDGTVIAKPKEVKNDV